MSLIWLVSLKRLSGEGQFNLERQLGWCNGCQSITPIEDFSDAAKVAGNIRSDLYFIRRDTATVFANILNVLFKSRREWLGSTIETINGNAKYIELVKARTDVVKLFSTTQLRGFL